MPAATFSKQVGNYYVGRTLGEGTYAKVKYGQHIRTGEEVAIKVLDKERIVRDDMMGQIKREIAILKHLKHPNIVNLYEVMESKDKIYMVMELVNGGELFHKIASAGPMKEEQARKIMHELLDAISICHAAGIYHRDLKPENVLIAEDGSAKLSDFGLGALPNSVNSETGKLMTTCGTPSYIAPEVLSKGGYDGAPADIWSLGVVLYIMMAGCLPFDEPSLPALFKQIGQGKYEVPPWFSKPLCSLLKKMMCVNVEERITLADLQRDPWVIEGGYQPQAAQTLLCRVSAMTIEDNNQIEADSVMQVDMSQSQQKHAERSKSTTSERVNPIQLITKQFSKTRSHIPQLQAWYKQYKPRTNMRVPRPVFQHKPSLKTSLPSAMPGALGLM